MKSYTNKRIVRRKGVNWKTFDDAITYAKTLKMSESSVPLIRKMRGYD